jgi:hypothetical protein
MHSCRACGRRFQPIKSDYFWCSWDCRQADGEERGYHSAGNIWQAGYDAGYKDGLNVHPSLPLPLWRAMIRMAHPDMHQASPLEPIANEVTRWLLEHRPQEVPHG